MANEITVQHIAPNGDLRPHTLTEGAKMGEGMVTYPGEKTLFS